jgi:hypothetical protein
VVLNQEETPPWTEHYPSREGFIAATTRSAYRHIPIKDETLKAGESSTHHPGLSFHGFCSAHKQIKRDHGHGNSLSNRFL